MIKLNPDKDYVKRVVGAINKNKFHCPCKLIPSQKTLCNFTTLPLDEEVNVDKLCVDGQENGGVCTCRLYLRDDDNG